MNMESRSKFEHRFYELFQYILITSTVLLATFDFVVQPDNSLIVINDVISIVIVFLSFTLYKRSFFQASVVLLTLGFLVIVVARSWVMSGYFGAVNLSILILIGFVYSLLLTKRLQGVMHGITAVGMLSILTLRVIEHPDTVTQSIREAIPYIFMYLLISIPTARLKNLYVANQTELEAANRELVKLNAEVDAQNEELRQNHESLSHINNHLEGIVEAKTHLVKLKNEKLLQLAFTNSHKVRAPLVRILGLIDLSTVEANPNLEFLFAKIKEQALEMDSITREAGVQLNEAALDA